MLNDDLEHTATEPRFLAMVRRHEAGHTVDGRHPAYRGCTGGLCIGYGHDLDRAPLPGIDGTTRLTEKHAVRLLRYDASDSAKRLSLRLPWANGLSGPRRAALVELALTLGIYEDGGLLSRGDLLNALKTKDWDRAADALMLSRWAGLAGARAHELAQMLRTGTWKR